MQLQRDRAGNLGYCTTLSLCLPSPSSSFIRFVHFVSFRFVCLLVVCFAFIISLSRSPSFSVFASLSGFGSCDCAGPTTAIHKYRKIVSKRVSSRQRQRLPRADCDGASDNTTTTTTRSEAKYPIDTNTIYLASHRWNVNVNYLASCPNKTPYSVYYVLLANRKPKWLLVGPVAVQWSAQLQGAREHFTFGASVRYNSFVALQICSQLRSLASIRRLALSNIKRKRQCNLFVSLKIQKYLKVRALCN